MDYIEIQGYKSIKKVKITLNPINILIGANGSGKSNFLSFFNLLSSLYERKLNSYIALNGGADKILHKGKKETEEIYFKLSFNNEKIGYSVRLESGVDKFVFLNEKLYSNGDSGKSINHYGGETESCIKITDNIQAKSVIKYLKKFRKYHFHDTSHSSAFNKLSNIENDIYYLYSDGSNLAAYLYNISKKNKKVYIRIIKTIQSIAPFFSDFLLHENENKQIKLQWKDKYSDTIYGATDFSDGTMRFVSLAVLFMQPNLPDTIIIDEPELGLHPTAISKLAGMIKSASQRDCQVICSTQSTELISHFLPEDIITVDQVNGETKFKRLTEEDLGEWIEDYSIDDLWKRNIILGGQIGN